MNNVAIVSRLNNLLTAEIEAILVYMNFHFILPDKGVQLEMLEISLEEMHHIQQLAELIVDLGGEPEMTPRKLRLNGKDKKDVLLHSKMLEKETIESYFRFLEEITISNSNIPLEKVDSNNLKTARVLKHIKDEEEDHLERFIELEQKDEKK